MISRGDARLVTWRNPRALRRRARVAIVALLVLIVWTTKPERGLRLRRDRADRVAHLDPELKRAWDDDARAEPLPPRCERELAGALPLDRLEGTLARSRLYARNGIRRRRTRPHRVRPRARERRPDPRTKPLVPLHVRPDHGRGVARAPPIGRSRSRRGVPRPAEERRRAFYPSRDASRALARISTHGRRTKRG